MKLRIVGDGTFRGTRLETEDGELIEGVQRISWSLSADQPTAKVWVGIRTQVAIDAEGRDAAAEE